MISIDDERGTPMPEPREVIETLKMVPVHLAVREDIELTIEHVVQNELQTRKKFKEIIKNIVFSSGAPSNPKKDRIHYRTSGKGRTKSKKKV